MRAFNVCHNYTTKLYGMTVPKFAWYGVDKMSVWVCVHKEQLTDKDLNLGAKKVPANTLELYRFNPDKNEWVITVEHSRTTVYICSQCENKHNWGLNNAVEYPKYSGLHNISSPIQMHSASYQTIPAPSTFKVLQSIHENRHDKDTGNIPLDMWESVAPMMYGEKHGKKSCKHRNWKKNQYVVKPYIKKGCRVTPDLF